MVDLRLVNFFKVKKQLNRKFDHNEFSSVFVLGAWLITIANYWFGTKVGTELNLIGF
jgi:small basic protein